MTTTSAGMKIPAKAFTEATSSKTAATATTMNINSGDISKKKTTFIQILGFCKFDFQSVVQ